MPAPRLILASRSARRALLLRDAGYRFQQADPPYDDPPQPHVHGHDDAVALATQLAVNKAISMKDAIPDGEREGCVILAADTICVGVEGDLIGQPANRSEARKIIDSFVAADHEVVTGMAVCRGGDAEAEALADVAVVRFGHVDAEAIERYLDSDAWRDKAGGYNLFDRQQAGWPIEVIGDETTVVGLAMGKIVPLLDRYGVVPSDRNAAAEAPSQGAASPPANSR